MAGRVVHVSTETHDEFKAECQRRGVRMRDTVDELIRRWLSPCDVVTPKPIPETPPPPTTDPMTLPPFWTVAEAASKQAEKTIQELEESRRIDPKTLHEPMDL